MPGETDLKVYMHSSISNIPSSLIWGLVALFGLGCSFLILRKEWQIGLRSSAVLMLAEWIFLILCTAVIFRETEPVRQYHLIPFGSYFHYPENSYFAESAAVNVLNVIMFVPIGLLLGLGLRKMTWKRVLLIGLGVSVSIELLQLFFKRGLCEMDDVIHNVLGCVLGYGLYRLTLRLIKHVQKLFQATV